MSKLLNTKKMSHLFSNYLKTHKCVVSALNLNISRYERHIRYASKRWMSNTLKPDGQKSRFVQFSDIIRARKDEAKRSILVQVQSSNSYKELYSYCSAHGTINQMLHYCVGVEPMHFILVEFAKESDVQNIFSSTSHIEDNQIVPASSQFLWFKASHKSHNLKQNKHAKLNVANSNAILKDTDLHERLKNSEDVSDQMRKLCNLTELNDTGIRLRYLVARQIETSLAGIFPKASAVPFGSSVNGYGKMGCDLDVVLKFHDHQKDSDKIRLMFQCKGISGSERTISQRYMELLGDILQLFMPGCTQVRKILQARVPIIKFYQQFADVECDLSTTNMTAVYMSELLYLLSAVDERVKPLVFTIRKWACSVGLTNSSPGRWITNFSLTLLVLAFLQKPLVSPPVLPSLNYLVKHSGPNDVILADDDVNCTFLRNIDKLNFSSTNRSDLRSLLREFFEYYSQFDFASKAVCLNEGIPITKPEHSAMYIVNPLERGLNVSKNVSIEEVERFKMEVRNAAWILESDENQSSNWGILSIFDKKASSRPTTFIQQKQSKLLQVSKLFEHGEDHEKYVKNDNVKKDNFIQAQAKSKSRSRR